MYIEFTVPGSLMHFADMNSFIHNNPMKAFYYLHFPDKNTEAQNIELSLYFPNRIDRVLRTECFLLHHLALILCFLSVWGLHLPPSGALLWETDLPSWFSRAPCQHWVKQWKFKLSSHCLPTWVQATGWELLNFLHTGISQLLLGFLLLPSVCKLELSVCLKCDPRGNLLISGVPRRQRWVWWMLINVFIFTDPNFYNANFFPTPLSCPEAFLRFFAGNSLLSL